MTKFKWSKNSTLLKSSLSAATGFVNAVKTEKKIRQVVLVMLGASAICAIADVGYFQIMMIIFSWVVALICEIFNTALEKALDYASGKEYHPLIRDGKDYASACTFIALIFAGALTLIILADRLFR